MLLVVEYCLRYLQSESHRKNQIIYEDFATMMPKAEIEKLDLDFQGLNMFLMKKNFKLKDFSGAGVRQLIYDIYFLCYFYVMRLCNNNEAERAQLDANLEVNPNKLIEKFVKIYCAEYQRGVNEFSTEFTKLKVTFKKYIDEKYPAYFEERKSKTGKDSIASSKLSSISSKFSFG